jgi:periplasmic protein TonB
MKKSIMSFSGKFIFPAIICGFFMASCASNDTNPTGYIDTTGTDTIMEVNTDTMMTDQTRVATGDSSAGTMMNSGTDSLGKIKKDTSSLLKTDKKGKKGKISILPADSKGNKAAMEADKEGFYANTEILPAFPGGQKALERFFEDNIVYPEAATDNSSEGTVRLTFAVDENGKFITRLL